MSPPQSGVAKAERADVIETALRALARYVQVVDGLLSDYDDDAATRQVELILGTVEDVLGRLAGTESIDGATARQLFTLRDDLSAQLLAAATLEEIELPRDAVVGILRRAAESTRVGLDQLSSPSGVLALRR